MLRLLLIISLFLLLLSCEESKLPTDQAATPQDTVYADTLFKTDTVEVINWDTLVKIDTMIIVDTIWGDTITDDSYEPDNSMLFACSLGLNEVQTHLLSPDNQDWFRMQVEQDSGYELAISTNSGSGNFTIYSDIYDESGYNKIGSESIRVDQTARYTFVAKETGPYYLKIRASLDTTIMYAVRLRSIPIGIKDSYEPDGYWESASLLLEGETDVKHTLTLNDTDYISIECDSGKVYEISCSWDNMNSGHRRVIDVFDGSNRMNPVEREYTANLQDTLKFRSTSDGSYYVKVYLAEGDLDSYSIFFQEVSGGTPDQYEPNNSTTSATPITVGASPLALTLTVSDTDYCIFAADSGAYYKAVLINSYGSGRCNVRSKSGGYITSSSKWLDGTDNKTLELYFQADKSDSLYLMMESYENDTVGYTISVDTIYGGVSDSLEPNNSRSSAGKLAADGSTHSLSLSLLDEDWFSFTAVEGKSYRFEINTDIESIHWTLYNDDEYSYSSIQSEQIQGNEAVVYTTEESGTMLFRISHTYSIQEPGNYTLSVTEQ